MKTAARAITALLAVVGAALLLPATPAAAYQFTGQRYEKPFVCVETHGWRQWPAAQAAAEWSAAANITVVARQSCDPYPLSQRATLRTYSDSAHKQCAQVYSNGWYRVPETKYHDGYWAPTNMRIWLNVSPRWYQMCRSTAARKAHVISWGIGRALGIQTPDGASVMTSWAQQWATGRDRSLVAALYGAFGK